MERDHSQFSDEKIVDLFFARKEEAVSIIERKYGNYLFATAFNVLGDEEDSRECVNDALFLLWTHIPPDRPESLKSYIARLARNCALNRLEEKNRQKRVPTNRVSSLEDLAGALCDPAGVESAYDAKLLRETLDRFVSSLGKRARYIFVCRYFCFDSVPKIAQSLGKSEILIFKELARMKKQLKNELRKDGFYDV